MSTDPDPDTVGIPPNEVLRFAAYGCELSGACRICSYKLVKCHDQTTNHVLCTQSDKGLVCPIHGGMCIGHLETDSERRYTMLPSSMAPNIDGVKSAYQRHKERLCLGRISITEYRSLTSKIMMSKKGAIRSIKSIKVEGSMKMVISIGTSGHEGSVTIPEALAQSILVPDMRSGIVKYRRMNTGDYAILVRQPCLWSGGIQPVRVFVEEDVLATDSEGSWKTNWTIRLPPEMCAPYAADFDGDEMSLFPVTDPKSIQECKSFIWHYGTLQQKDLHNQLVPPIQRSASNGFHSMLVRSTLCWSDIKRKKFMITEAHKKCQLSVSSFLNFRNRHDNEQSFVRRATSSMTLAASKSSMQSDIGALSRRSKLGAERLCLSPSGCPSHLSHLGQVVVPPLNITTRGTYAKFSVGNPAVRAISKITARVMQITLKVMSTVSLSVDSPTLTLLSGSDSWMVITSNGSIIEQSLNNVQVSGIEATCSLWHISQIHPDNRLSVSMNCIKMILAETNVQLDPVEFEYMVQLVLYCSNNRPAVDTGISVSTFSRYETLPNLWQWNACYYNNTRSLLPSPCLSPSSLVERRFICNFGSLTSILDCQMVEK